MVSKSAWPSSPTVRIEPAKVIGVKANKIIDSVSRKIECFFITVTPCFCLSCVIFSKDIGGIIS